VAGRGGCAALDAVFWPGARRPLVAAVVPLELELIVDAVIFRAAPLRVALAFSTMLERTLEAWTERDIPLLLSGDPGRAICDLLGDAGLSRIRELDDVGESTCPGRTGAVLAA
jgi:hypothetical protein